MNEIKSLKELIQEQVELKGLSAARLQQLTGIPERFLQALLQGEFNKMPAAPYVRGYLMKISEILNLNGEEIWRHYKKETEVKTSGAADRLPENRFAIKTVKNKKGVIIWTAIAIAMIVYLVFNINRILGRPSITITIPSSEISMTTYPAVTLTGKIDPKDTLKINGQEITVNKNGEFEKTHSLQLGLNNFEFSIKRFLGKETNVARQIIYQPQSQ